MLTALRRSSCPILSSLPTDLPTRLRRARKFPKLRSGQASTRKAGEVFMLRRLLAIFEDSPSRRAERMIGIYGVLLVMNLGAWIWAGVEFGWNLSLLGVALIVYGLGLRHAVDADHIAAIDNVTRKLMQGGAPAGHRRLLFRARPCRSIVVIASVVVAGGRIVARHA